MLIGVFRLLADNREQVSKRHGHTQYHQRTAGDAALAASMMEQTDGGGVDHGRAGSR
jgi:hypothetical protein